MKFETETYIRLDAAVAYVRCPGLSSSSAPGMKPHIRS
jgi:hypothetical protein